MDPEFAGIHRRLGRVYAIKGDFSSAMGEFEKAKAAPGPGPELDGLIGYAQASSGNVPAAKVMLNGLIERSQHEYVSPISIALIYIGLGNRDQALDMLN